MKTILLLSVIFLASCTTIHFDNGGQPEGQAKAEEWHHNFGLALYEASEPVNLKNKCQNTEWTSVKTEVSLINGLASGAVNGVGPIWYPKSVQVSCK